MKRPAPTRTTPPALWEARFCGSRSAALVFVALAASAMCPHALCRADADGDAASWATGIAFQRQLEQPVDVFWSANPLQGAIEGLSQSQHVAILIDRRVDPGQRLTLSLKGEPLERVLLAVADQAGLGTTQLGPVVYLGPAAAANNLKPAAALLEREVRRLPKAIQPKFLQTKPLQWDDLATPREILGQLAEQNRLELVNPDRMPHDLWAAADLPPCTLAQRLTLIAFQYDLTLKITAGGKRMELVPLPDNLPPVRETKRADASRHPASTPKKASDPSVELDQIRIQRMSVQDEPLGPVLRQVANRLGLELKIDEAALEKEGISLDQHVTMKVENATIDDLLRELLRSTRLTFTRQQKMVEITPAK